VLFKILFTSSVTGSVDVVPHCLVRRLMIGFLRAFKFVNTSSMPYTLKYKTAILLIMLGHNCILNFLKFPTVKPFENFPYFQWSFKRFICRNIAYCVYCQKLLNA